MIKHSHQDYDVAFYGKSLSTEQLKSQFPNAFLLKQVHSDICVLASAALKEADAHWTKAPQQPLVIQTADCLPVMIYLPLSEAALAIHAGWRGVEQRIVSKSLVEMKVNKKDPVHVYIGPHIQMSSFEVDLDVARKIMSAHELDLSPPFCEKKGNKYFVDLASLVVREIKSLHLNIDVLFVSEIDTKTHADYYSFRDGDRGGRNYSLINKKSAF